MKEDSFEKKHAKTRECKISIEQNLPSVKTEKASAESPSYRKKIVVQN